jgi:3-oxoacyl-[acyl-carrier-protein] synthase-3
MDINAACAGFTHALSSSAAMIESGRARRALVIGADELSIHLDWKDRSTCVLFGDGAGAVVLQASKEPGIMASTMGSDGSGAELLMIKAGGSRVRENGHSPNADQYLRMNGPQIYRWAVQNMSKASARVIEASGLKASDIDLFIPHQANLRIIEATARKLGMPLDKVYCNVEDYGNTSAASIPIALTEAIAEGRVKIGDNIVLASFGAGLSWSALAMRWGAAISPSNLPWAPIRQKLETRVEKMRSALIRQQRRVAATIDERLRRDG